MHPSLDSRCEELRNRLDLSSLPSKPEGNQDAGVLILLHDDIENNDIKVLLCVRNQKMRRHPGEVCFPGGMMDEEDGGDVRRTAIREAYEEVGISEAEYVIIGNLPSFRARFGVLIHPTVAVIRHLPKLSVNESEVESVFWMSLSRFLEEENHSTFEIDPIYYVHSFQFTDAPTTYGVTALMCIVVSIGILQRKPNFDLLGNLSADEASRMTELEVIRNIYKVSGIKLSSKL